MNFLFLLNGAVTFMISLIICYNFLRYYKNDYVKKITNWFSIISLSYFALFLLFLFYLLGYFNYNDQDFVFVYSIIIFVNTLILFKVIYLFNNKKSMPYILSSYFIAMLSVLFSF